MTGNEFLTGPRRGRRAAAAVVVGLAVIAVVAAGWAYGGKRAASPAVSLPSVAATGVPGERDSVGAAGVVESAPAGVAQPLRLVRGARRVNGVRVGYPHSPAGAVSAAIEYATQLASTLDRRRAVQIGRAIADVSYGDPAVAFAAGPVNSRRRLGLPPSGPLPAGASMTFGAVAFQVRDMQPDRVTVVLLAYLTTTVPGAGIQSRLGVFPVLLAWAEQDWKLAKRAKDAPDFAELRYPPGSAQASAAGWRDFVQ